MRTCATRWARELGGASLSSTQNQIVERLLDLSYLQGSGQSWSAFVMWGAHLRRYKPSKRTTRWRSTAQRPDSTTNISARRRARRRAVVTIQASAGTCVLPYRTRRRSSCVAQTRFRKRTFACERAGGKGGPSKPSGTRISTKSLGCTRRERNGSLSAADRADRALRAEQRGPRLAILNRVSSVILLRCLPSRRPASARSCLTPQRPRGRPRPVPSGPSLRR